MQIPDRPQEIASQPAYDTEDGEGAGRPRPVAEIPADAQRLLQIPRRAQVLAGQLPHVPQVGKGIGLAGPVAQIPGCRHGGGVAGDGLIPRAVIPQQARHARCQRDNPGQLALPGGLVQARQQAGPLGLAPRQRLPPAGQDRDLGRRTADGRSGSGAGPADQQSFGAGSGMLVVIQQPPGGLLPVVMVVKAAGQRASVLADQVVQPVPARSWLGEQVVLIQCLQGTAGIIQRDAVESGRGVRIDVGAWVQPEPAEQLLLPRCEVVVGQVERRGDRRVLGG